MLRTSALRDGLALVPPMGWSNWEAYGCDVNEQIIRDNVDAIVDKGLLDAGYNIAGVDDCWAELSRNSTGHLVPNSNFSSGIKALADYVHGKGMQFGIYSSAGEFCCQHTMPGSLGYEWIDAFDFAEWGVDFLKYDGCFMEGFAHVLEDSPRRFPFTPPPILRYPQMAMALNKTGRNITYLCNFPWQFWSLEKDPADGGDWVGEFCHMWRVAGDARPGYASALGYVDTSQKYAQLVKSGPGRWNHLDSLEIGNNKSNYKHQLEQFSSPKNMLMEKRDITIAGT
jgi:alpha-galactosidase